MVDKIKKFLSNDFIKQTANDKIKIDLKESKEICDIVFENGNYIEIKDAVAESVGKRVLTDKLAGNTGDGIVLNKLNGKLNLIIIEYKKNIGNNNFGKACNQLNSTYIKIAMLLNVLFKIEKINVIYVIVGKILDRQQSKVISAKMNKPNLFNKITRSKSTIIKEIPFNFNIPINDIFKKTNVNFIHKECNSNIYIH